MSDTYQLTADKFIFKVAKDRSYSEKDVWVKTEDGLARLGVTDFFQRRGGDIVFIELPEAGKEVKKRGEIAQLETIKAILPIESPVDGAPGHRRHGAADRPALAGGRLGARTAPEAGRAGSGGHLPPSPFRQGAAGA